MQLYVITSSASNTFPTVVDTTVKSNSETKSVTAQEVVQDKVNVKEELIEVTTPKKTEKNVSVHVGDEDKNVSQVRANDLAN